MSDSCRACGRREWGKKMVRGYRTRRCLHCHRRLARIKRALGAWKAA